MDAGLAPRPEDAPPYTGPTIAGAVLASLFFPLFALIAALILVGNERSPQRRAQLRTWAWVSVGWILLQVIVAIVLISSITIS
ncbi:MAG TPA: hypothetical protein VKB43_12150 [Gaiellaceae bacterium]|nr:hypothetical protein [Gaiellaceae bacterium]